MYISDFRGQEGQSHVSRTIRMFLTPPGPVTTGRREKSDHATLEDAKAAFASHPNRRELEAIIYVDGAASWIGECSESGTVRWRPWHI